MELPSFDMFWPNVALWSFAIFVYLCYLVAWLIDLCISCVQKKYFKESQNDDNDWSNTVEEYIPLSNLENSCKHFSPTCCALNGCEGPPSNEYLLKLKPTSVEIITNEESASFHLTRKCRISKSRRKSKNNRNPGQLKLEGKEITTSDEELPYRIYGDKRNWIFKSQKTKPKNQKGSSDKRTPTAESLNPRALTDEERSINSGIALVHMRPLSRDGDTFIYHVYESSAPASRRSTSQTTSGNEDILSEDLPSTSANIRSGGNDDPPSSTDGNYSTTSTRPALERDLQVSTPENPTDPQVNPLEENMDNDDVEAGTCINIKAIYEDYSRDFGRI